MAVADEDAGPSAATSSTQTPAALTTTAALTSVSRPSARMVAPATRPVVPRRIPVKAVWLATAAPCQEGGGAGHRQRQPGVVDVGVVVQVGPGELSGTQGGHAGEGVVGGDLLVDVADAEPAGQVVGPEGGAHAPRRGRPAVDGEHERHPPDQVGGVPEQPLALGQGLGDEAELPLVEVPQPAVDQLGRLRRRPRGEIVALDQGGAQAAGGGVEGHARPGDAPADHEDVEGLARHPLERGGTVELARRAPRGHVGRVIAVAGSLLCLPHCDDSSA